MLYTLERIIADVRTTNGLNRQERPAAYAGDDDVLTLDDVIKSVVESVARQVAMDAPVEMLGLGEPLHASIRWERRWGWILLPDDFMRLIVFEMDDWERPVTSVILPEAPDYAMQRSRVAGVGGCPQRPVCAIVPRQQGKALEFYSCLTCKARVRRAMYAPLPKLMTDGSISFPELLYPTLINEIAKKVCV